MADRNRLPTDRHGLTRRLVACGLDLYVTVNFYPDSDTPAEVFATYAKAGSTLQGVINALCTTASVALQYGAPWPAIRDKWRGHRFEPSDQLYSSLADALSYAVDEVVTAWTAQRQAVSTGAPTAQHATLPPGQE
jgi:hypothetical protein